MRLVRYSLPAELNDCQMVQGLGFEVNRRDNVLKLPKYGAFLGNLPSPSAPLRPDDQDLNHRPSHLAEPDSSSDQAFDQTLQLTSRNNGQSTGESETGGVAPSSIKFIPVALMTVAAAAWETYAAFCKSSTMLNHWGVDALWISPFF